MQALLQIALDSGKSAVELTLYVLLPIMVLMMAVMRLLEAKGVLSFVSRVLAPALKPFGVPGLGVFAMLQMTLVSYAAPVSTLALMDEQGTPRRSIAASLAMILAMSQANAVFPLLAVGLSLPLIFFTSVLGGLAAATVTFYLLAPSDGCEASERTDAVTEERPRGWFAPLVDGGQKGVEISLRSIPILVLAIFVVKVLSATGVIPFLERGLAPALGSFGLSGFAVLPLVTKYLAGGTAMMGVTIDLVHGGSMSANDLNRVAGFMINPLDLVGVSVLASSGPSIASVVRPAILGAAVGVVIRGFLHFMLS